MLIWSLTFTEKIKYALKQKTTKNYHQVCIETSITLQIGLRAGCYDIDEQLIMTKVLICAIRSTSLQAIKGKLSALILLNY